MSAPNSSVNSVDDDKLIFDLVAFIEDQMEFSQRTYGPGKRTEGLIEHIGKEVEEIQKVCGEDLSEWIDVIILAIDGAWRHGFAPNEIAEALWKKLRVNKFRKWPDWRTLPEGQAIEHVRE